ncbi:MAG TPA: hypothetical protein VE779_05075, partial [Candidatus Angelobacter sp.]|nr:hypothetical protein [Candidatus Angelobacter sp.]
NPRLRARRDHGSCDRQGRLGAGVELITKPFTLDQLGADFVAKVGCCRWVGGQFVGERPALMRQP